MGLSPRSSIININQSIHRKNIEEEDNVSIDYLLQEISESMEN